MWYYGVVGKRAQIAVMTMSASNAGMRRCSVPDEQLWAAFGGTLCAEISLLSAWPDYSTKEGTYTLVWCGNYRWQDIEHGDCCKH